MTRNKESFDKPLDHEIGLYTCGPTVYNFAHIGNLRTYVFEDILKRTLIAKGYTVKHIMNITDVGHLTDDADQGEDKMEKGAKREGKTAWDIAEFYTQAFLRDIQELNILPPTTLCKATDNITEQINMVQVLIDKGVTYETTDGIYFDTTKIDDYGKLAQLDKQELKAGARVDLGEKKNPHDFALWKFSPTSDTGEKRQMEWLAFGRMGFPGWHIECSAMSIKYLGEHFDIHCGGIDHVPVHHTNEIAQSETATGKKPWVDVWMHGEFLNIANAKMAKSGDNFITLATLKEQGISPLAYRFFLLQAQYRKQLTFSFEALEAAQTGLQRLKTAVNNIKKEAIALGDYTFSPIKSTTKINNDVITRNVVSEKKLNDQKELFLHILCDDLNTPAAIAYLQSFVKEHHPDPRLTYAAILEFDTILGLNLDEEQEEHIVIPHNIQALLDARAKARAEKNWTESDRLRDEIMAAGYIVEDTGTEQHLKKK